MKITNLTSSDLTIRNSSVFVSKLNQNPGMLFIWADWCPHCHDFIPTFKELSKILGNEFNCFAIEEKELKKGNNLAQALGVKYFPTLKFFNKNGEVVGDYPSDRKKDKSSVLDYVCKFYHHCVYYQ